MLAQLLNPTLFGSLEEMLENRHRLNTVMFRRTKADACQPNGSPLFARRWVHTESFLMGQEERLFYEKLRVYLEDGFNLARRQGSKGQALGFLMAIFQKIAASSFAAVRRTLKRRLLMLTLHEALLRDKELDIEGRERLTGEARELIHEEFGLSRDSIGRNEVDRILADLKYRLVKKLDEEALEMASDPYGSEYSSIHAEEAVSAVVELHLPEERLRIEDLLKIFPQQHETKAQKLLDGLGYFWRQNPNKKIVIFATYLGTVELIAREIDQTYPGQGVVVLRGGDHGAKVAAERRFRQKDGPRVLVCTAAGREGINLQFARILFNFDLPWNPMDVEQRIGRIHRYGQNHTAQVYNLVLSDTIEGCIFLLLGEKLTEIARTVGRVDNQGNVAEDLRAQILGQLSERLNYDRLYQQALSDPELKRTQVELEAALSNSREARQVRLRSVSRPRRLQPRRLQALLQRLVELGSVGASREPSDRPDRGSARRRRKKVPVVDRQPLIRRQHRNEVWSADFVFDRTADGRVLKCLTIVDDATTEAVAVVPARAFGRLPVTRVLDHLAITRGLPRVLRTHFRSVSAVHPSFGATDCSTAHSEAWASWCSSTIRTARSRTSGENRLGRPIDPILPRNEVSEKPGTI